MAVGIVTTAGRKGVPAHLHIDWLNMLLWGGVAALALEHISHQEIVPYFPFLTAMSNPADTATMLYEMATIGGGMLLACVAVWAVMVFVYNNLKAKSKTAQAA
jgi:hypothetical protein